MRTRTDKKRNGSALRLLQPPDIVAVKLDGAKEWVFWVCEVCMYVCTKGLR